MCHCAFKANTLLKLAKTRGIKVINMCGCHSNSCFTMLIIVPDLNAGCEEKNNRQVCLRVPWCIGWVWFALPLSIRLFLCLTFYTVPWLWWAGSASSHPYRGCLVGICFGSISAEAGKENSCFCTMTWRRVLSPHTVKHVRWQTRQEIVGRMDFVFCFK